MRKAFRRNWTPKIIALILATAIWMLIKSNLEGEGLWEDPRPPKAGQASKEDVEEQLRVIKQKEAELEAVLEEIRKGAKGK
jgi:hypothetical protein